MLNVVLFEPEIPPNTGNVIRLCANTGAHLHLIKPLGFEMDDKRLQRAGLDYHEWATVQVHESWQDYVEHIQPARVWACSTKGTRAYHQADFRADDTLLFGPESRGLPVTLLQSVAHENLLRIPMLPDSRSLNLSNAVAVFVYEAWRQMGYPGAV